nr:LytTR family DNA-binding domain-containing protein [Allomuricauda sp.]
MRFIWSDKRFYVLSILALVAFFGITLLQNYIRYQHHNSYSIWVSIVYLAVSVLLFIPVIILTLRLQKLLKKKWFNRYWIWVGVTALATLGLFYLFSNVVLHSIRYFDHFVDREYARYYFGREALYHLILIIASSVFVYFAIHQKETILVNKGRKHIKLDIDQVHWIEVEGHYLNFYTDTESYLKRERLGVLAKQLEPNFIRIHRKYVVNRSQIKSMEKDKRDEFLVLYSGKRLKIGQSFKPIVW